MDELADYMRRRFFAEIRPPTHPTHDLPSISIPVEILCEAERMVDTLVRARQNPGI